MLGVLGGLALGGLVLGACGIPTQLSASPLSASLSRSHLPGTRPPLSPCTKSGCVSVDVFFVTPTGHLAPAGRVVPRDAKLDTVIRSLLYGPTAPEQAKTGVTTVLNADIRLMSASVTSTKKVATLTFNSAFGTLAGTQQVLGVAQVVYTVSDFLPGTGVVFEITGFPIEVPVQTGALATTAVVHVSQYATLRTTSVPTTTTTP